MARVTARAAVMQMIYEHLAGGEGGEETLQMVYDELRAEGVPGVEEIRPNEPGKADRAYITRVLDGVLTHLDELDAEMEAIKDEIKAHMTIQGVDELAGIDWKVSYKTVTGTRFDAKAFRKDHAVMAEKYTRQTTTRRLTIA